MICVLHKNHHNLVFVSSINLKTKSQMVFEMVKQITLAKDNETENMWHTTQQP
jgi:hypothetical protein